MLELLFNIMTVCIVQYVQYVLGVFGTVCSFNTCNQCSNYGGARGGAGSTSYDAGLPSYGDSKAPGGGLLNTNSSILGFLTPNEPITNKFAI